MVYIPNWCSFSPISTSRLVIPLKQAGEEKKIKNLFPKQSICHQFAVALFASMVQICFYAQLSLSLLDVLDPKHTNQRRLVCHVNPLLPQMARMLLACSP